MSPAVRRIVNLGYQGGVGRKAVEVARVHRMLEVQGFLRNQSFL